MAPSTALDNRRLLQMGSMDRPIEPQASFVEIPVTFRMLDQSQALRLWQLPVPLRVRCSGFKQSGLSTPVGPDSRVSALRVRGIPHLLTFDERHWLVLSMFLGSETEDLGFDKERPHHRVDGDKCVGYFTVSPKGLIYMANIDLSRSTLAGMAARVQENHPLSRILVRLLPRMARGTARWYEDRRLLQFWIAI